MAPWHRIGPRSARRDLVRLSHAGLAGRTLLTEALARLRQVLPVEAYFAATTDPATVLFTDTVRDGIPPAPPPLFLTNELLDDDVNQFTELARGPDAVRGLYAATGGVPTASPRYRDIMAPVGLGDELRAALRVGGRAGACSACTANAPRPASATRRPSPAEPGAPSR